MLGGLFAGSLFAWLVLGVTGSSGEITEQDMRDAGLSDEQIQEFQDKLEASRTQERKLPTVEDYLAGGRGQEGPLTKRIAYGGEEGLEIARQVLHRTELREMSWPDYAVLNGLSKRASEAALDVLEEAVAVQGPKRALWFSSRMAWAAAFRRLHGDAGFELARARVEDPVLTPEQRALHLLVFRYARRSEQYRPLAIEVYRPYLHAPEPELQRAAVLVAGELWDYDARGEIEQVAWASTDWKARGLARSQEGQFLDYGPDIESRSIDGHGFRRGGYDPEGLRAWRARRAEWSREQYRLTTGEEPPPGWPNPEPRPAADAAGSSPSDGSSRTTRPRGTR
jgi:hypothetical protein